MKALPAMSKPNGLAWINFLNQSSTWETQEQAEEFLSRAASAAIKLTGDEVRSLSQLETYMREQLAALHFQKPLALAYINRRLERIHFRLEVVSPDITAEEALPSLRAQSPDSASSAEQLFDTLLLQFAIFLGDTLDGHSPYTVSRCEAICRKKSVADCQRFYEKFRSLEDSWKAEVSSDLKNNDEVERCADFFQASPGAKFCSDACRFNSFALRKQMSSPSYQAEKQRRYRLRQKAKS